MEKANGELTTSTGKSARGRQARASGYAREAEALRWLQAKGLRPLAQNARFKTGELDLVMLDGDTVVFIEVRARRSGTFGGAAASVDARKQARLVRAAQLFLLGSPTLANRPCRFDCVLFDGERSSPEWIKNAFGM